MDGCCTTSKTCLSPLEMRGQAGADPAVRSRQCHADPLLKDWAYAIAKRSTMRKARVALARRLAIIMHAICETGRSSHPPKPAPRDRRPNRAPARSDALGREQTTTRILLHGPNAGRLRFQPSALHPAYPISAERARRERRHPESVGQPKEPLALDILGNGIRKQRPFPTA